MPRTAKAQAREEALLPKLAHAFGANGYRRTTTAELARVCGLQETQLYRLWPSKKAMFLAVIDYLFGLETADWKRMLEAAEPGAAIAAILDAEGRERGRSGLHRITLALLNDSAAPEIHAAVQRMYRRFHRFIADALRARHARPHAGDAAAAPDPALAAWALIGLGTITNIGREFDLFTPAAQHKLMNKIGLYLAGEPAAD